MKLLLLIALIGLVSADCPNPFGNWRQWSSCLWMRNEEGQLSGKPLRKGFMDACNLFVEGGAENLPDLPMQLPFPEKCGNCAFKIRCRNRQLADNCFPIETEKEICTEYNDICMLPKTPMFNNCKWGMMGTILTQCSTNRPDVPEWKREGFRKGSKVFPEQICVEKGDKCACCCHPYMPNKDATGCVPVPAEPECNDFGEFNDWTECLWYPFDSIASKVKQHCFPTGSAAGLPKRPPVASAALPEGFQIPEKCGFCSFKMRCRKRDSAGKPGCFPVDPDKKACGPDDCPTCGDVCTLPQLNGALAAPGVGKCDWHKKMMMMMKGRAKKYMSKMKNYWRKRGFMRLLANMPVGSCKEVGDSCKCCCHPYEPSEDGSTCELKQMCKLPSDLGITWGVNEDSGSSESSEEN
jgi:hypothetical protein